MPAETPAPVTPTWMLWTGRVLSVLVIAMLLMSAGMKLSRSPEVLEGFKKFGYPEHTIVPIAAAELACAVLYAIPQTSVLGAALMTGYLGGATATHVRVDDPFLAPIIAGMLAWGGLVLRDSRLRALIPWHR